MTNGTPTQRRPTKATSVEPPAIIHREGGLHKRADYEVANCHVARSSVDVATTPICRLSPFYAIVSRFAAVQP